MYIKYITLYLTLMNSLIKGRYCLYAQKHYMWHIESAQRIAGFKFDT